MTDWLSLVDRIDSFFLHDATLDRWSRWYQQFKLILLAYSFDRLPNTQRVALLMMKCQGFLPVWEVLGIDIDLIEFDDLVSKIVHYLNPTNCRLALSMRVQKENESFEKFAKDLEALSHPCRYTDEKILRDFFVMNMHPSHSEISNAICQRHDLSFEEAVAMAKSMTPAECFAEERVKSEYAASAPIRSLMRKDAPSILNIRMTPISSGIHEVKVLNLDPMYECVCQVCPVQMLEARSDFLLLFNETMGNCKELAVTPIIGCQYAALLKCTWFRVEVLSIEGRQKKGKILAIDYGWISTAPFSVFRNIPLDFRPPAPLLWDLKFRTPLPQKIEQGEILNVDVAFVNDTWVASLIPENPLPLMPNDVSHLSGMSSLNLLFPKRSGYDKPRSAVGDNESRKHQKDLVNRVDNTQLPGRTLDQSVPNGKGRSKSNTRQNKSRPEGRGVTEASVSSDTDNSQETVKPIVNSTRTCRTKDSAQQSNRLGIDRGSVLDNKSEGRHRNNTNNRFDRGHVNGRHLKVTDFGTSSDGASVKSCKDDKNKRFDRASNISASNGRQQSSLNSDSIATPNSVDRDHATGRKHSGYLTDTASRPCSAGKLLESGVYYKNKLFDHSSIGYAVNGSRQSPPYSESAEKPDSVNQDHTNGRQHSGYLTDTASGASSAGNRHKNKRFDGSSNVSALNGRQQSSSYPESSASPNLVVNRFDRTTNGTKNHNVTRDSNANKDDGQHTFQRRPGNNQRLSNVNQSRAVCEPSFLPRSVELEVATQSHQEPALKSVSRPPQKLAERLIPLGRYIKVHLVDRSPDGEIIYCICEDLMKEFMDMSEKLSTLEGVQPLSSPEEGGLCLTAVSDIWCRAEITKVHPSGQKVKLKYIDFGNKETKNVSELLVLPSEYWNIQPYAFPVKVSSDLEIDSVDEVEVKTISRDKDGLWEAEIKIKAPPGAAPVTAPPAGASSSKSSAGARPSKISHPPPIPKDTFTGVKIVHVGPEGTFAVPDSEITLLGDIQAEINSNALTPLEGVPELHQLYAAPFDGELFRAKVLEIQPSKCLVRFVDFGNEAVIPIRDLRRIPERLCENIVTFKIHFDPRSDLKVQSGMDVTVTPVEERDGSWLVQLFGEPSLGPDHSLPDDGSL